MARESSGRRRAGEAGRRVALVVSLAALIVTVLRVAPGEAQPAALSFESGPVRPLALSPDGALLFACNIPDARLEIFAVEDDGLVPAGSVPVGLEPVAVAARTDDEVWVVNHLSDSISIVDVPTQRVVRTLLVGDEPRDLVFAGPDRARAFVTTAHRGQHRTHPSLAAVPGAGDPRLTTEGVPRADVWVFAVDALGDAVGGVPLRIVELFGDTPRGLAVSPGGETVYAAVFHSGNQTTTVSEGAVCDGFESAAACAVDGAMAPGGNPGPATNFEDAPAPEVGLIVRHDGDAWRDERGRDWSGVVRFELPDHDVFAIDATSLAAARAPFDHVGTTLFNMVVNPVSGAVYVTNQEAVNHVRFEGEGTFAGSTVQGHLAEMRISVLSDEAIRPVHLNGHLDYAQRPALPVDKARSLSIPLDIVVDAAGTKVYVAAYGSSRVGVFDAAALEAGTIDPRTSSSDYLTVSGGGPAGLALDEARGRLYVLTRFDDGVSVLDVTTGTELQHLRMHDPEPVQVVSGRPFLYDATTTSSNGEASCASCHVFGDMDHLAWDLGDPDASVTDNPIPIDLAFAAGADINGSGRPQDFHPMKGPMTTQSLRGMRFAGAMHWRGDRATGHYGTDAVDADLSFRNFNVAFPGLVGRDGMLADDDMQAFADFALAIVMPPNPVRNLDGTLSPAAARGADIFDGPLMADAAFTCEGCHRLDPGAGFFGTGRRATFENETQIFKVPQLRNLYQKVGMFGMPAVPFFQSGGNGDTGEQVRGYGFLHDGSADTLFRFMRASVFTQLDTNQQRRDLEAYMLAFDSDLAPIVGQQITLTSDEDPEENARLDLLLARAGSPFTSALLEGATTECDLIAKVRIDGRTRGYLWSDDVFRPDDGGPSLAEAALRSLARVPGQEVTVTCVPPGSGRRMGIDRDLDEVLDGLDNCPAAANPGQSDADGDGVGDACEEGFIGPDGGMDAGSVDAGTVDAGLVDAGLDGDAPEPTDAGGREEDPGDGCGCVAAGAPTTSATTVVGVALAVLLLIGVRRRR